MHQTYVTDQWGSGVQVASCLPHPKRGGSPLRTTQANVKIADSNRRCNVTNKLDLAVLESRWWQDSNDSVRPIFDLLAGILAGNPYSYHYEMFNNGDSIKEIIRRLAGQRDIHHLYIAAHGDAKSISGPGSRISRTILSNLIADVGPRQLYGVFFGSCLFGEQDESLAERARITLARRLHPASRLGPLGVDGPVLLECVLPKRRLKGDYQA